jgi:hypothetical protein
MSGYLVRQSATSTNLSMHFTFVIHARSPWANARLTDLHGDEKRNGSICTDVKWQYIYLPLTKRLNKGLLWDNSEVINEKSSH